MIKREWKTIRNNISEDKSALIQRNPQLKFDCGFFVSLHIMKNILSFLISVSLLMACNNTTQTPETLYSSGLNDATRNFLKAALEGNFDMAKKYMLIDTANIQYLTYAATAYQKLDTVKKEGYANSSIIIHSSEEKIKDSLAIVIYSNSFMNNPDTLRILKQNNNWLVDLKYLYEHDYDTAMQRLLSKDTLK